MTVIGVMGKENSPYVTHHLELWGHQDHDVARIMAFLRVVNRLPLDYEELMARTVLIEPNAIPYQQSREIEEEARAWQRAKKHPPTTVVAEVNDDDTLIVVN